MDPSNLENIGFSNGKTMISRKSAFRKSHRILIDLGANMASFWLPKTFQIHSKINPKMHQFFASIFFVFWLHIGTQVGAMLATFSSRIKWGPCGPPLFLLGLRYFSIYSSWIPLGPIRARFWMVWASILRLLGSILEVSVHDVGPMWPAILVLF